MKYELEKYSSMRSRHTCPNCDKRNQFARYIDTETGEYIAEHVGRCNREDSCGYHYTPKQFFDDNKTFQPVQHQYRRKTPKLASKRIDFLPADIMAQSVDKCRHSALFEFVSNIVGDERTAELFKRYHVGVNKDRLTIFWQVDGAGMVRQCKGMRYNPSDGRRDKEFGARFFGKRILNNQEANLSQSFFGEHLLNENRFKPVCLVESEKSALISALHIPDCVWIASGGKHGVRMYDKSVCKYLIGRKVILFPDLGAYDLWKTYASTLSGYGVNVSVSDLLEKHATPEQRAAGLDIADYLLTQAEYKRAETYPILFTYKDGTTIALNNCGYPASWDQYNHLTKTNNYEKPQTTSPRHTGPPG